MNVRDYQRLLLAGSTPTEAGEPSLVRVALSDDPDDAVDMVRDRTGDYSPPTYAALQRFRAAWFDSEKPTAHTMRGLAKFGR